MIRLVERLCLRWTRDVAATIMLVLVSRHPIMLLEALMFADFVSDVAARPCSVVT